MREDVEMKAYAFYYIFMSYTKRDDKIIMIKVNCKNKQYDLEPYGNDALNDHAILEMES